jgi:uncharacterized protein involved in response to NO
VTQATNRASPAVPAIFAAGFRFYFLAAGLFAIFSIAAWLFWLAVHAMGGAFANPAIEMAPHFWHAHEMVYGYTAAVIAGFFLTAVPNWTGSPPARAAYVAGTAAVWLAGRLAIWFSGLIDPFVVALIDLAFVPLLGAKITSNLWRKAQARNFIFLGLLTLLFAGNLMMHLEWMSLPGGDASAGIRLGLLTTIAMIAIIGGRIIPGFTRNALNRRGHGGPMPVVNPLADRAGILSAVLVALCAGLNAPYWLTGSFALAAATANGVRLARWGWLYTLSEPILWSLHLGFFMLVAGYGMLALAQLTGEFSEVGALHFLGIGAAGGMTLAVMSRAALGHTGRPLIVARPIAFAYIAIALSALIRAFGTGVFPEAYYLVMLFSGGFWLLGFVLFAVIYLPILAFSEKLDPA